MKRVSRKKMIKILESSKERRSNCYCSFRGEYYGLKPRNGNYVIKRFETKKEVKDWLKNKPEAQTPAR